MSLNDFCIHEYAIIGSLKIYKKRNDQGILSDPLRCSNVIEYIGKPRKYEFNNAISKSIMFVMDQLNIPRRFRPIDHNENWFTFEKDEESFSVGWKGKDNLHYLAFITIIELKEQQWH